METAFAAAGNRMFGELMADLYALIKKRTGRSIKQWETDRKIDCLYKKIAGIRRVKTIWQTNRAVDLATFYCDPHIIENGRRRIVRCIDDLGSGENYLIEGRAGQGKSIFLRYLCATELARGLRIPLFVELRRISRSCSARNRIYAALEALQIEADDDLLATLAESGRVSLLLDGFDEVPASLKARVATDIEDLASSMPGLRLIVTSRPEEAIHLSNHFTLVELDELRGREYAQLVHKLSGGAKWAARLVTHVETKAPHVKGVLRTPLMVVLLVMKYSACRSLPGSLPQFYEALFNTLLQRHDGTKSGFSRERRCNIDDYERLRVFEALAFLARRTGGHVFSSRQLHGLAEAAIEDSGLRVRPMSYIDDIVRITCLIVREGDDYQFIHRSVQEYYAASFVSARPEPWAAKFYALLRKSRQETEWAQTLAFLAEIDQYRYLKYFLLPSHLSFLNLPKKPSATPAVPMSERACAVAAEVWVAMDARGRFKWLCPANTAISRGLARTMAENVSPAALAEAMAEAGELAAAGAAKLKRTLRGARMHSSFYGDWTHALPGAALLKNEQIGEPLLSAVTEYVSASFAEVRRITAQLKASECLAGLEEMF